MDTTFDGNPFNGSPKYCCLLCDNAVHCNLVIMLILGAKSNVRYNEMWTGRSRGTIINNSSLKTASNYVITQAGTSADKLRSSNLCHTTCMSPSHMFRFIYLTKFMLGQL